MRIQQPNTMYIQKAYSQPESNKNSRNTPADNTIKASKGDSVTLSSTTQQLQKINSAIDNEQPGRSEKISALKSAIAKGEYNVDPEAVAEKFLSSFSI